MDAYTDRLFGAFRESLSQVAGRFLKGRLGAREASARAQYWGFQLRGAVEGKPSARGLLDRGGVFFQLPGTRFELVTNGFSDHYSTD